MIRLLYQLHYDSSTSCNTTAIAVTSSTTSSLVHIY